MANTTPIVTTVTNTATKEKTPKETGATPRVNILDFCEEHYEEILPVIMDRVRRDKRKEVIEGRVHSSDLARLTRQAQLSLVQTGKTLGIITAAEVVLADGTPLLADTVLEVETTPTASKSHMVIPAPPTGQGPHIGLTLVTATAPIAQKEEGEMNPRYLMCRRVTPVREDTGSLSKKRKPTDEEDLAVLWTCEEFDELPPKSIDGYKDLKAAFLAYFMQHVCRRRFLNGSALRTLLQPASAENQEPNGPGDNIVNRSLSPYNGIIGKLGIREIQAVPSTTHRMLKFLVDRGIVTIRSTILIPLKLEGGNWRDAISERSDGTMLTPEEKLRYIRMAAVRHDMSTTISIEAGIMREVYYHDWLSNRVMVKKHDGSWRMCMDFTDLNKACPQDCYPLPEIDWNVKFLCGYPFKCFLDAYKGYHQIQMAKSDEEKTAFHTRQGVNCYIKMPFGLKNAGVTYQRLVDKAFDNQVGRNIEVYVDDLVIKSHTKTEMLRDIDETFRTLQKINMKLNPKKCTFGAVEGMFLGYMISPKGIKPCPDKTEAVLQLPSLRTIKEA
ncbi:reverse transcriptase domain-containing protein [Tanacetum coccineum]